MTGCTDKGIEPICTVDAYRIVDRTTAHGRRLARTFRPDIEKYGQKTQWLDELAAELRMNLIESGGIDRSLLCAEGVG